MPRENCSPITENIEDRIDYLTVRINILKDHLNKYKDEIDPSAREYISNDIEANERELKIRKEYPLNF